MVIEEAPQVEYLHTGVYPGCGTTVVNQTVSFCYQIVTFNLGGRVAITKIKVCSKVGRKPAVTR